MKRFELQQKPVFVSVHILYINMQDIEDMKCSFLRNYQNNNRHLLVFVICFCLKHIFLKKTKYLGNTL